MSDDEGKRGPLDSKRIKRNHDHDVGPMVDDVERILGR
jgi:hypothetical protein